MRDAAIHGSAWTAAQVVFNKIAAGAATIALGFLLTAEDFGIGWFAITAGQFIVALPVVAMIDVLLASPRRIRGAAPGAQRIATRMAIAQAIVVVAAGAVLSMAYPWRTGLMLLMTVVALRPLADAATVVPLSRLRIRLEYRFLAKVDGIAALMSSAGSVGLAALGMGGLALVAPPIAAILLRATLYRRRCRDEATLGRDATRFQTALRGAFLWAAVGSYAAAALAAVDMVALGTFCDDRALGIYAFAASLATQMGTIIAFQAFTAVQPIIGQLKHDQRRQADGAKRAIAMVSALLVPVLLVQAAVGGPVIAALWGGKWDGSIVVFQLVSLSQAVGATQWPAAFVLKAQGRFKAYLAVQGCGIGAAATAYPLAAMSPAWAEWALLRIGVPLSAGAAPGASVALVGLALSAVLAPVSAWLALRATKTSMAAVADLLWRPWVVAAPVALACGLAALRVRGSSIEGPMAVAILLALATAGAAVGIGASVSVRRMTLVDAWEAARHAQGRILDRRPERE